MSIQYAGVSSDRIATIEWHGLSGRGFMRTVKNKGGGGNRVSGKGELDQGNGENKVVI